MKYIGVCIENLEDVAIAETKGKKLLKGRVVFDKVQDYKSLDKIYSLEKKFRFKTEKDILKEVKKLEIKDTFCVKCSRKGEHKFTSFDLQNKAIKLFENKVDFKNPKDIIYIDVIKNTCLIGFLVKNKIGKRNYRVKLWASTINPLVAHAMLNLIDYKKEDVLFDPMCKDGVILIEAALLKGKKIYGKEKNIRDARINSKIAKVKINLSEEDVKLKKIDKVASFLPSISKRKSERLVSKIYEYFLEDLKNFKGKMAVLLEKRDLFKKICKFKLIEERTLNLGESKYYILVYKK